MQRTGHSTTAGMRSYKRIGEKLRCVTSDVLNSAKKVKTEKAPNTDSSECEPKCSSVDENQFPVCEPQCSNGGNKFPFLVPRTSQSISTLTELNFFSTSLELLLSIAVCKQVSKMKLMTQPPVSI